MNLLDRKICRPCNYQRGVFLLLMLVAFPALAEVRAWLDRGQIADGESVRLMIEAKGQFQSRPDTQPLAKDFEVQGTATGSRVNIVNGKVDARTTWTITLRPKSVGTFTIPSLQVAGESTRAISLRVTGQPAGDGSTGAPDLFIETEMAPDAPWVQGMVRYTVRVFHAVPLARGELSDPASDNALVRKLGADRQYAQERHGRHYRVIERRYAIFPQASGALKLPAPVLNAGVAEQQPRGSRFNDLMNRDPFFGNDPFFSRDPFDSLFATTRPVRIRGREKVLQVRPRPDAFSGAYWLPASNVELAETWDAPEDKIHVGEPVTRTLTLRAEGLTDAQLPEMTPARTAGANAYPDRARGETQETQDNIIAVKTRRIAWVPSQPGELELPPLEIRWWDTVNNQERVAELPGRTFTILPAAGTAPVAEAGADPRTALRTPSEASTGEDALPAGSGTTAAFGVWTWISALFALLWLLTLGLWRRSRNAERTPAQETRMAPDTLRAARRRFHAVCKQNDPRAARQALLDWAAVHWRANPPAGLDELSRRLQDPDAKAAVNVLDQALYAKDSMQWKGDRLAEALRTLPALSDDVEESGTLPALYPRG